VQAEDPRRTPRQLERHAAERSSSQYSQQRAGRLQCCQSVPLPLPHQSALVRAAGHPKTVRWAIHTPAAADGGVPARRRRSRRTARQCRRGGSMACLIAASACMTLDLVPGAADSFGPVVTTWAVRHRGADGGKDVDRISSVVASTWLAAPRARGGDCGSDCKEK